MATLRYKPNFIFSDPGLVTRASKVRVAGAFAFLLLGAFLFGVVLTQVGFCQIHSLLTSSTFDPGFDIQPEWKQQVLSVVLDQHKGGLVFLVWINILKHFIFSGTSIGYKTLLQVMKCSSIYEVNCSGSHLLDAIFILYITYQSIQDLYLFNLSIPIVPQEDSQKLQSVLFHLIICCWFLRLNS